MFSLSEITSLFDLSRYLDQSLDSAKVKKWSRSSCFTVLVAEYLLSKVLVTAGDLRKHMIYDSPAVSIDRRFHLYQITLGFVSFAFSVIFLCCLLLVSNSASKWDRCQNSWVIWYSSLHVCWLCILLSDSWRDNGRLQSVERHSNQQGCHSSQDEKVVVSSVYAHCVGFLPKRITAIHKWC